jgi:hypothetical protein
MEKRIEEMRQLMRQATQDGLLVPEAASELVPIITALKRLGFRLIDEQFDRLAETPATDAARDRHGEESWEELKALRFVLNRLTAEQRAAAPF